MEGLQVRQMVLLAQQTQAVVAVACDLGQVSVVAQAALELLYLDQLHSHLQEQAVRKQRMVHIMYTRLQALAA
jgi:hypothetical protein